MLKESSQSQPHVIQTYCVRHLIFTSASQSTKTSPNLIVTSYWILHLRSTSASRSTGSIITSHTHIMLDSSLKIHISKFEYRGHHQILRSHHTGFFTWDPHQLTGVLRVLSNCAFTSCWIITQDTHQQIRVTRASPNLIVTSCWILHLRSASASRSTEGIIKPYVFIIHRSRPRSKN